jgi:hypothetical protein
MMTFKAGWGAIAFVTLIVLVFRIYVVGAAGRRWLAGILSLLLSYPAVRTIVDGNVEFLVILGLILLEYGYWKKNALLFSAGILFTVSKVQEVWLLVPFLPLLAGRGWTREKLLVITALLAAVIGAGFLWKGREWFLAVFAIQERGSVMDSSLLASVQRLGGSLPLAFLLWAAIMAATVFIGAWKIRGYSWEAVGLLLSASLILSPYAAGNNLLVLYSLAVIPLVLARQWEGVFLAVLINLPYLAIPFRGVQYQYSAAYWTGVLLVSWILCIRRLVAGVGLPASEPQPLLRGEPAAERA